MTGPAGGFDIAGRVVVVTGASSGLGVAMAAGLAAAGAKLVLAARRANRLEEVAGTLAASGAEVITVPTDVSQEADVDALVAVAIEHFGSIDALVNNAGITDVVPAENESIAGFKRVLDINLVGAFICAQRCARPMLAAGKGAIVNVASVLGLVGAGQIPQASYTASKGGLVNLTRELAAQWARRGVRVNGLAPAWFASEMTGEMFDDPNAVRWMRQRTPMGRVGEPEELVGPLTFLLSDASSYITGQTLPVDGGWTIV
jgi:NAD(P)-dependent dehydrogenase (short-subunit alcohol dehydrogenase family)